MSRIGRAREWAVYGLAIVASLSVTACAPMTTVPHVMVLPGAGKSLDQFDVDDLNCRSWAERRIGISPGQAGTNATAGSMAIGTVLGAATGAAIGAAAGNPAMGAAVGAGAGLLGGTSYGVGTGQAEAWETQHRYDVAYAQCMYASGNQVPGRRSAPRYGPLPGSYGPGVPPPPYGAPPPPPGVS